MKLELAEWERYADAATGVLAYEFALHRLNDQAPAVTPGMVRAVVTVLEQEFALSPRIGQLMVTREPSEDVAQLERQTLTGPVEVDASAVKRVEPDSSCIDDGVDVIPAAVTAFLRDRAVDGRMMTRVAYDATRGSLLSGQTLIKRYGKWSEIGRRLGLQVDARRRGQVERDTPHPRKETGQAVGSTVSFCDGAEAVSAEEWDGN